MFGKKKDKKKKVPLEKFESLTAGGVEVEVLNFLIKKDENGEPIIEMTARDAVPALHYDELDFELRTSQKIIKAKGKFREAYQRKKFKIYIFDMESYEQFYA